MATGHVIYGATNKAVHPECDAGPAECTQKGVYSARRNHVMYKAKGKVVHTGRGACTRRGTKNAVHRWRMCMLLMELGQTKSGLQPLQTSCYLRYHSKGCTHRMWLLSQKLVHSFVGVMFSRGPGKAVHLQGGAHQRRSRAIAGGMLWCS